MTRRNYSECPCDGCFLILVCVSNSIKMCEALDLSSVQINKITAQQLNALGTISPCQLRPNAGEAELLTELFSARGLYHDSEAMPRRRTLHSIIR